MKLQPIIRNVSTDKNDANNFVQEPEYTLYVKYAIMCITNRKEVVLYGTNQCKYSHG